MVWILSTNPLRFSDKNNYKYCNSRYGYCIEYPSSFLYPQKESYNGDGRVFTTHAKQEAMRVWGYLDQDLNGNTIDLKQSFKIEKKSLLDERAFITFEFLSDTYYVLSGIKDDHRFYQKTIIKRNAFATAITSTEHLSNSEFLEVSKLIERTFK
jgi:hypothetical protein